MDAIRATWKNGQVVLDGPVAGPMATGFWSNGAEPG